MEAAIIISILLYLFSAAGYLAYFLLQKNDLQRAGFFLLLGGFVFHTARPRLGLRPAGPHPGDQHARDAVARRLGDRGRLHPAQLPLQA
ncbi:MAG: hypothetical protein MZV70_18150 [Desulfobacterales bacterium]|nr:hypothetical protein [Desulfobacterales bacterium]